MPTQDFIFSKGVDEPRHEQNMPEGVDTPVPSSWKPTRPGDMAAPSANDETVLLGHAGPSNGYTYKLLAQRWNDVAKTAHEHRHDVEPLLAEIAGRRASHFGRAPIMEDVDIALHILSYDVEPAQGEEKWRPQLVHDCGHDEHRRRTIVNSIPLEILQGTHQDKEGMRSAISGWWEKLEDLF